MLRGRLPDDVAMYPDPTSGINLRVSLEDLQPTEAVRMENMILDGGLRKRFGAARLNAASLGAFTGLGGIRFYFSTASKTRIIAYNNRISSISDAGVETVINAAMTAGLDTFMEPWSTTDALYITNGTDTLRKYDGTTFSTVAGTNIPTGSVIKQMLDRLFCIQGAVVVSTDPRSDSVWSPTSSSWAAYRPSGSGGNPTALHVHPTVSSTGDFLQAGLLILQAGATSLLTGTDFGSSVVAASPPTGWNAILSTIDRNIGTQSPYSLVSVTGLGTFWFTSDFNVAWLPIGAGDRIVLIGDKLFSNRTDINGANNVNTSALGHVLMAYHDRKLKLFLPVESNSYTTIQYWLDLRPLQEAQAAVLAGRAENIPAAWSGPHSGQSLSRVWVESQAGDANLMFGLEGNSATGLFVYELNAGNIWTDDVGTATNDVQTDWASFYHDDGMPSWEKLISKLRLDTSGYINNATVAINDLHAGSLASGLTIRQNSGAVFTNSSYANGLLYGTGHRYGEASANNVGIVDFGIQGTGAVTGDAIQVRITHTTGDFRINRTMPHVKVRKEGLVV
mgnify:FL=1